MKRSHPVFYATCLAVVAMNWSTGQEPAAPSIQPLMTTPGKLLRSGNQSISAFS